MPVMKKTVKSLAVLSATFMLASCGGDFTTDIFGSDVVLPCPNVTVLPGADTITIFRAGPGRDLVDVTFEGTIEPLKGECVYQDDDSIILAELFLQVNAVKGPAADSDRPVFPFFIAIADQDRKILSKKVFETPIEIPDGKRRGAALEEMVQKIPVLSGRDGRDYTIVMGFQLTPEQLEYNRKTTN